MCIGFVTHAAKINVMSLRTLIHELRPAEERLPKKRFHFQLASDADNDRLSGYKHNAVTPFALRVPLPVVICKRCLTAEPPILYLGGGKTNVKLSIPVADLIAATDAIVGEVTDPR